MYFNICNRINSMTSSRKKKNCYNTKIDAFVSNYIECDNIKIRYIWYIVFENDIYNLNSKKYDQIKRM